MAGAARVSGMIPTSRSRFAYCGAFSQAGGDARERGDDLTLGSVLTAAGTWKTLHVYIDPAHTPDPHTTHPAFPVSAFELPSALYIGIGQGFTRKRAEGFMKGPLEAVRPGYAAVSEKIVHVYRHGGVHAHAPADVFEVIDRGPQHLNPYGVSAPAVAMGTYPSRAFGRWAPRTPGMQ
jgi:hypothetical protein